MEVNLKLGLIFEPFDRNFKLLYLPFHLNELEKWAYYFHHYNYLFITVNGSGYLCFDATLCASCSEHQAAVV